MCLCPLAFKGHKVCQMNLANQPCFTGWNALCTQWCSLTNDGLNRDGRMGVVVMPGADATSVSPKAQSPNGCDEWRGRHPGAREKTQRKRRDGLRDANTGRHRNGGR